MVLLVAITAIGAIGIAIGTEIQSAQATQNDNNQVNNNNQASVGGFGRFPNENAQGNQN